MSECAWWVFSSFQNVSYCPYSRSVCHRSLWVRHSFQWVIRSPKTVFGKEWPKTATVAMERWKSIQGINIYIYIFRCFVSIIVCFFNVKFFYFNSGLYFFAASVFLCMTSLLIKTDFLPKKKARAPCQFRQFYALPEKLKIWFIIFRICENFSPTSKKAAPNTKNKKSEVGANRFPILKMIQVMSKISTPTLLSKAVAFNYIWSMG